MSNDNRCRAVKRDGKRCANLPKFGGFCGIHLPRQKSPQSTLPTIGKTIKTGSELVVITAAAVKLIEKIIAVWQSLPFGAGPQMPEDYRCLTRQIGPIHPASLTSWSPCCKGPDSIDWHKAREVYDAAKAILTAAERAETDAGEFATQLSQLDRDTNQLLDSMLPQIQDVIYEQLGQQASDENCTETA